MLLDYYNVHWRWRHTKPRFSRQLLSFQCPSWYISTQFSSIASPGWNAVLGSPGAQLRKPRDVLSVQAQPTAKHTRRFRITEVGAHVYVPIIKSEIPFVVTLFSCLTVVVPGEADPQVVVLGVVEVPDELHLGPAVNGRQLPPDRLAVVSGLGPGETLLAVVREVAVVTVGRPERQTHPSAGGRGGRRLL